VNAVLPLPPLLDVQGLTVRYSGDDGPVVAVRDVSFTLRPGQALGIVGESGSGKSSIAGAILDLLGPGAGIGGKILFEGKDLAALTPNERPWCSIAPLGRLPHKSARWNCSPKWESRGPRTSRAPIRTSLAGG
jgi:ABC-type glutathione transport system ATPase component